MYKGLFISSGFHLGIIALSIFTLPFLAKKPIDIPPLVSVELIQISDITNIPYAPKAKKIIDKVKKKSDKLVSEQAPPKKIEKEKTKKVNLDKKKEKIKKEENKKVNLDLQKDNIDQTKSKKTPTPETKKEKLIKDKLEAVPLPDSEKKKIITKEEKEQQPSEDIKKKVVEKEKKSKPQNELKNDEIIKEYVKVKKPVKKDSKAKQVSEFESKELFDPNSIAALIDKSYEDLGETNKKTNQITQSQDSSMETGSLTLSEEDALKAQIFGCWSIPLGLPYDENLLVRIRLKLKPDGTLIKTEVLDHARMNKPGQNFYKVLAESALRAIQLCQPLKVPTSGYDKWKNLQLNFDPREMLGG